jgi:hypothetical protein
MNYNRRPAKAPKLPDKLFKKPAVVAAEGCKSAGDGPIVVYYIQTCAGPSPALLLVVPFPTASLTPTGILC